jgi:hypothetical protein
MCELSYQVRRACRQNVDAEPGGVSLGAPALPRPAKARAGRRKLWELPHKLHCPVIGTCLSAAELRALARKDKTGLDSTLGDYQLHISYVSAADERNPRSIALQKALERKHGAVVRRFAALGTTTELAARWEQCVAHGEVPAALWATVTHPLCDIALFTRVYEAVHMLSHQIGAGQRADLRRLAELEIRYTELQRDFDSLVARTRQQLDDRELQLRELRQRSDGLDVENRRLQRLVDAGAAELAALAEHTAAHSMGKLEQQLARVAQQRERWRRAAHVERDRRLELERLDAQRKAESRALARCLGQTVGDCHDCELEDTDKCLDLRGLRILCVGGRNQLVEHYRQVVCRCNGRFEHHDGGREESRQRLESMLRAADAVLCATDSVSHDAYYRLKRYCKRHDKRYVLLESSGLSTFARAIESVAQ